MGARFLPYLNVDYSQLPSSSGSPATLVSMNRSPARSDADSTSHQLISWRYKAEIDTRCQGAYAVVLKYRHIQGLTHEETDKEMHYSPQHLWWIFNDALDQFGGGMSC
jgi:hypothetical protein